MKPTGSFPPKIPRRSITLRRSDSNRGKIPQKGKDRKKRKKKREERSRIVDKRAELVRLDVWSMELALELI